MGLPITPLRRRITEDMLIRNLSICTQQSYLDQVTRFANHLHQSPERLGPEQVRDYQRLLAAEKRLAPSSVSIAVSALRFLYGVTLGRDWDIREYGESCVCGTASFSKESTADSACWFAGTLGARRAEPRGYTAPSPATLDSPRRSAVRSCARSAGLPLPCSTPASRACPEPWAHSGWCTLAAPPAPAT